MTLRSSLFYEFGPYRLDPAERALHRAGEPVPLPPRAFDLLVALVDRAGRLVSKEELLNEVWPGTFVEEANLSYNVSLIRKALSDSEPATPYIETVAKHGYRFTAPVRRVEADGGLAPEGVPIAPNAPNAPNASNLPNAPIAHEPAGLPRPTRSGGLRGLRGMRAVWPAAAVAVLLVALAAGGVGLYRRSSGHDARVDRPGVEPTIVPITSLRGNESQPSFSSDGSRIAFVWDGEEGNNADIYVKLIDEGTPLRLTTHPAPDSDPVWSPDDRHVAFAREGDDSGIYLVPALGGPERRLSQASPRRLSNHESLDFSPDGRFLAMSDSRSAAEPFRIFLLSLDTLDRRPLTSPPADVVGDDSPAFSPDGRWLAFTRNRGGGIQDLYVVPVAGGEPRRLTFDDTMTAGIAWSRDQQSLVFSSRRVADVPHLWRVPIAGGRPERIAGLGHNLLYPAISRRSHDLAYTQSTEDTNVWRLAMSAAKGPDGAPTRLISSSLPDFSPQYSPDGSRIVFVSSRSGSNELWMCDRDGANAIQLTRLRRGNTGAPRWSPDGRWVAFDSLVQGNRDIYVVGADGGTPRRLTTEPAEDMCPSWSRDGRWIYFGSSRGGSLQIWKQPVDAGAAVQPQPAGPTDAGAVAVTRQGGFEGVESADGAWFYYAKGRGIPGIWRVPAAGGVEAPVVTEHDAGLWRSWAVTADGLYFVTGEPSARPVLRFYSFATGQASKVTTLGGPITRYAAVISISPDGRWMLYSQLDEPGSDIMLASQPPD